MGDTSKMIEEQNKRKYRFIEITTPTEDQRLTRNLVKEKIRELEELLKDFKSEHENILEIAKPDIPYIVNDLGGKVIQLMESAIDEFRRNPLIALDMSELNTTLGAREFEKFSESMLANSDASNTVNQHVALTCRKLDFKIKKLMLTIESIQAELSSQLHWSKDLLEIKNKFLFNQWTDISILEEELAMTMGEHESIPSTNNAYAMMNSCISEMISKIQIPITTTSSEPRRHGKLPDLKIPIFKGDYKNWRNFKDIYDTMIHHRSDIPIVEKMEYLKVYVDGEPSKLISNYTLSAENYSAAYDVLVKRYDNKRKLFTIYIENMSKPIGKYATAESVKELHDSISEGMTSIKNLGIDNDSWGPIIVHLAILCLDNESRALFESKYNEMETDIPQIKDFLKFLESRYKTLEILDPMRSNSTSYKTKANQASERKTENKHSSCLKCEGDHKLFLCPKFLSLSVKSRYRFVKASQICVNCLYKHNDKKCESKRTCKLCSKFHNSLLHFKSEETQNNPPKSQVNVGMDCNKINITSTEKVLATAQLQIRDKHGYAVIIRVLIDTGAQANFITEGLVQKLKLKRVPYSTEVTGIGKFTAQQVKHAVEVNIEPVFPSDFDATLVALIMGKELTSRTPEQYISENLNDSWPTLQLADPSFRTPGDVDMILGIGFFTKIVMPEILRNEPSKLIALKSKIGWLILGEIERKNRKYTSIKSMISIRSTTEDISRFWEIEDIPDSTYLSCEDKNCEELYTSTHKRLHDGRYMVMIPFKEPLKHDADLNQSRKRAMCRFYNLEAKFKRNPDYAEQYKRFIDEYLKMGHMVKIKHSENDDCYYMPHHAVLKPGSTSTKLRVVFDASAKTPQQVSLNQLMLPGPRLQDDLAAILLRWRCHRYVISADVEKMYRQILIAPQHRRYQRIFWRSNPNDKLAEYELTTVTYGTTSAPYLAIRTLQQLARDDFHKYPLAAEVVLRDFYVDDVLSGADTISDCILLRHQLQNLLQGGGLMLRKWSSNTTKILEGIDPKHVYQELLSLQDSKEDSIKTLGLVWKPREDVFTFKASILDFQLIKKTKRNLCSDVSKMFDPLGWLAPFTIVSKILFQSTWKLSLGWDDHLPDSVIEEWKKFRENLKDVETINIPRWLNMYKDSQIELHGFCDASKSAYSAAIYVKVVSKTGDASVRLLIAKTKVAPIKHELTIPRLELSGALLLSKLYTYVIKTFSWQQIQFFAWCDSTIALTWIKGDISRWNSFVANRVEKIKELTINTVWNYIPTNNNPADCASRGISALQLSTHDLWWTGPKWLINKEEWPSVELQHTERLPETRKIYSALTATLSDDTIETIIARFSTYNALKRCVLYCLRFINNCRTKNKLSGNITANELCLSLIKV